MAGIPLNSIGHELSPIQIETRPSVPSSTQSRAFPIFKSSVTASELPPANLLKDKLKKEAHRTQELDLTIRSDLGSLSKSIEELKHNAQNTNPQTIGMIIQYMISDIVLKGSAATAQTGIPLLFDESIESLEGLVPATEIIKFATDILDIGTGTAFIIYRSQLLNATREQIARLKANDPPLSTEQLARLQKLEKLVEYEDKLLSEQIHEQGIRTAKNFFSYVTFILSWVEEKPMIKEILEGAHLILSGVTVLLEGFFFHRAHRNLDAHQAWSKAFKTWMKSQTATVKILDREDPRFLEVTQKQAAQILAKRKERHEKSLHQIQALKIKLETGELKLAEIHQRIKSIKRPGLHQFLSQLNVQDLSLTQFRAKLNDRLGFPLNDAVAIELRKTLMSLRLMEQSTGVPDPLKEEALAKIRNLEEMCLQDWVEKQDDDSLLSSYVDYHSVLDSTIKQSLAEMVKKKHKIEKSILEMKTIQTGTRFTAATILFTVAVALAILAALSNPITAAPLILTLLTLGSVTLSMTLFTAVVIQTYRQKPGITLETFKGAYIELSYYYVRSALSKLKEKIEDYFAGVQQEKRDRIAVTIDQNPLMAQLAGKKGEGVTPKNLASEIEMTQAEFHKKRRQSEEWMAKATALNEELEKIAWKDFAKKAHLQVTQTAEKYPEKQSFDTLETFNKLLTECDFDLLSEETKKMIAKQFDVDIQALQVEVQKDPTAVKRILRDFFNMQSPTFVKFVGLQLELGT